MKIPGDLFESHIGFYRAMITAFSYNNSSCGDDIVEEQHAMFCEDDVSYLLRHSVVMIATLYFQKKFGRT